jgi:hypothetical protein
VHHPHLPPGQVLGPIFVDKTGDDEKGAHAVVAAQQPVGLQKVIAIAIVEGEDHRPLRQGAAQGEVVNQLFEGDGGVAVFDQVAQLPLKVLRRHR